MAELIPWAANPPDDHHRSAVGAMVGTWLQDAELGEAVAGFPWVADGVQSKEAELLRHLERFAQRPGLAPHPDRADWPWYAWESPGNPTFDALIADPRRLHVEMLILLIGEMHRNPGATAALRPAMLDLAPIVGRLFDDWLTAYHLLRITFHGSARTALALATFANGQEGDLGRHLLASWAHHSTNHPDIAVAAADWPWIADGLTNGEAAYLVALSAAQSYWNQDRCEPTYYDQLLQNRFVQSKTFSLPLAGDVTVWVIQAVPFPSSADEPAEIEESVRTIEELTRAPFPASDIILLTPRHGCLRSSYSQHSMILHRSASGEVASIPHETGHYYFDFGPHWLSEGGAEVIRVYVEDRKGIRSLDEARVVAADAVLTGCGNPHGLENILHYTYHLFLFPLGCGYSMGQAFLLALVDAVGEEAWAAALNELRALSEDAWWTGRQLSERLIYDTFLKHTPPDRQADFLDVYSRLHGGPELPDIPDDHGDSAATATAATLGEPVTGMLDYRFDLDFFRFRAEEGRSYRIGVNHDTLRPSAIWMYSPQGYDLGSRDAHVHWRSGTDPSGPWIHWTAPASGDYYVAVENFAGEDGAYTLTISPPD